VADEEEEEDETEETTVGVVDTETIVIATTAEDAETTSAWEIEEAAWTTTIADADVTTSAVDVIDHPIGEALLDAEGTIVAAAGLGADHLRVVTIAETIEEEGTQEVLLVAAMMIAIGVAMKIIEMVAVEVVDTTMTSVVVPQKCTVETIVEEMIAVIDIEGGKGSFRFLRNSYGKKYRWIHCTGR